MKLYTSDLSSFGARARLVLAYKEHDVEVVPPPGGSGSDEFKQINPNGKIPALELDSGVISESFAIMEYLNETLPGAGLMPVAAEQKARVRMLSDIFSNQCIAGLNPLFGQLFAEKPDLDVVSSAVADASAALDLFEQYLSPDEFLAGNQVTLADCSVAPFVLLLEELPAVFDLTVNIDSRPNFSNWWNKIQQQSEFQSVLTKSAEMLDGFLKQLGKR